jgi:hypothetical protein
MVVAGFEKFILELCGDPAFAPSVVEFNNALEKADIEADGSPHALQCLMALEYIANGPVPLFQRVAKMQELLHLQGKVVLNMREFCGW